MIVKDVMDEIAARIGAITGLRTLAYPPAAITPPAAFVDYPETITFDQNYRRGLDRMTLPVVLVVGNAYDRAARDNLSAYCDGAGAMSVKANVEAKPHVAFGSVRVTQVDFDVWRIGTVDYMAAQFTLDVVGGGA